jgi:predicted CoA-substrate-specific enzyme activase
MRGTELIRIGIDIGSLYLKIVEVKPDGRIGRSTYRPHRGQLVPCLKEELPVYLNGGRPAPALGVTGVHADVLACPLRLDRFSVESAIIRAVREQLPGARNIIDIGGAVLTLIRLNAAGELESAARNSLCAAGTGSFLDEQSERLGICYEELEDFPAVEDPPSIATRCAVFAKTDLIHHQQAGRSRIECWAGLCRGMVSTLLSTLLKGRPLEGRTALIGGVTRNREILRELERIYGTRVYTPEHSHLAGAYGAALLASARQRPLRLDLSGLDGAGGPRKALATRPALRLRRSSYPSWQVLESYLDGCGNEVRLSRVPRSTQVPCFLGIDIGSTSTKLAVIDSQGEVICDIYRLTAGEPIAAVKRLFQALRRVGRRKGLTFQIEGCATTGSGRKMIGKLIGADRIINEITCHLAGAARVDSTVTTIFEIGGQDSKYIQTSNGRIVDAAMNYVCAAGTGSFVAEQARRLGFRVEEVGEAVMGVAPPHTSDRCTVFMEQDVNRLLQQGYSKEQALAAVLYSVVQNYLNKVVGNRPYSRKKIFFQGATARNRGLVAAFENLLGAEIVVSPYAHVMGAWGAALLAREWLEDGGIGGDGGSGTAGGSRADAGSTGSGTAGGNGGRSQAGGGRRRSSFRGLELADREVSLRSERCRLCPNRCDITYARIEGDGAESSWGYLCGREPESKHARENPHFRFFRRWEELAQAAGRLHGLEEAPAVALPRALFSYSYLPLFQRFLNRLGYSVRLSGKTTGRTRRLSARICGAEFCFPVKAALGHVLELAGGGYGGEEYEESGGEGGRDGREGGGDSLPLFLPHLISAPPEGWATNAYYCPYLQSFPSVVRSSLQINGLDASRILSPIIDFRLPERLQVEELCRSLAGPLAREPRAIAAAWKEAVGVQERFARDCALEGEKALRELEHRGEKAIAVLGRPYNIHDPNLNLGLVRKIAELGWTVIPLDFLAAGGQDPEEPFRNLYWSQAQKILRAAYRVRASELLQAVCFTNFNCGPDSFLESYLRHLFGEKPLLVLELDEHEADAGYLTRIEAFLDVLKSAQAVRGFPAIHLPPSSNEEFRRRKIWIPRLHPVGAPLFAAAFRAFGFDAQVLPLEDEESFEIGRRLTSGKECLPMVSTIGALVKKLRETGARPGEAAYFMSTASGPCRFGQYALKDRMILNDLGYADIPILSPSTLNCYQGLPEGLRRRIWTYVVASDILLKLRCKKMPYAEDRALAEAAFEEEVGALESAIEAGGDFKAALLAGLRRLAGIPDSRERAPAAGERRPLVGIVGEIYVRCNPFTNARLIEAVERCGGEAWPAPLSEWFLYTAYLQRWRARKKLGGLVYRGLTNLKNFYLQRVEQRMYRLAERWLADRQEPDIEDILAAGTEYLPINFEGESILTVGRAVQFIRQGAELVVNCAPFGCMPGTLTSALLQQVQQRSGIPVVSIFYDGQKNLNEILAVYLQQLEHRSRVPAADEQPALVGRRT